MAPCASVLRTSGNGDLYRLEGPCTSTPLDVGSIEAQLRLHDDHRRVVRRGMGGRAPPTQSRRTSHLHKQTAHRLARLVSRLTRSAMTSCALVVAVDSAE